MQYLKKCFTLTIVANALLFIITHIPYAGPKELQNILYLFMEEGGNAKAIFGQSDLKKFIASSPVYYGEAKPDRYVVEDFEDINTWRTHSKGSKGTWFAGHIFVGTAKDEKCNGKHVGIIKYNFNAIKGPYYISAERKKVQDKKAYIKQIEFFANPKELSGEIAFDLIDAKGVIFRTARVHVSGSNWAKYCITINEKSVNNFNKMEFPASIHRFYFFGKSNQKGNIYIDDITLVGTVSDDKKLTLFPLFENIEYDPASSVILKYYMRNATGDRKQGTVSMKIMDFYGLKREEKTNFSIPPYSETLLDFDLGKMGVGHYEVEGVIKSREITAIYNDMFGVFLPNNRRLNKAKMFFGIQTQEMWHGYAEQDLHAIWCKKLGIDIVRVPTTASRLEMDEGDLSPAQGFARTFNIYQKYNIDVCVLNFEIPPFLRQKENGKDIKLAQRKGPIDYKRYEEHAYQITKFFQTFPNIRYIEYWNEPDIDFFQGTYEEYAKMSKAFYKGAKKASKKILITTGSTTAIHPKEKKDFSRKMIIELKDYYDLPSFHSHGSLPEYIRRHALMEKWLDSADVNTDKRKICNTESGKRGQNSISGRKDQAVTLMRKITYARSTGNTEFYIWFLLQDNWDMDLVTDDSWGLVTSDLRPKPGFLAYNELIRQLSNTLPEDNQTLHPELTSYKFKNIENGESVYVSWPKQTKANFTFLMGTNKDILRTDMLGRKEMLKPKNGKVSIVVNEYPFYLKISNKW